MRLNEKKFNFWFSLFLLCGMIAVAVFNFVFEIGNPDARLAIEVIAGLGAIMGVTNTVLSANGSLWTFLFGILDVVCCSIVTWDSGLMGNFGMHVFYFLPMQFVGLWQWRKRGAGIKAEVNAEGEKEVAKVRARRLCPKHWAYLAVGFVLGTAATFAVLYFVDLEKFRAGSILEINKQKILLDAIVVVLNIIGQILMSLAFTEQWYIWISVNVFSIMLWTNTLLSAEASSYTAVMALKYVFYLLNSVNGLRIWLKLAKKGEFHAHIGHGCC